jgi:hypothetical protein
MLVVNHVDVLVVVLLVLLRCTSVVIGCCCRRGSLKMAEALGNQSVGLLEVVVWVGEGRRGGRTVG